MIKQHTTADAARPFDEVFVELDSGRIAADARDKLAAVIAASIEHGKVGGLSIKLKIVPRGRSTVVIAAVVDASIPEADRQATTFFLDEANRPLRDDPRQERLPLADVREQRGYTVDDDGVVTDLREVRETRGEMR